MDKAVKISGAHDLPTAKQVTTIIEEQNHMKINKQHIQNQVNMPN